MGKALQKFITVRYEQDHNAAKPVLRKFNIQAFPTLLVLDSSGAELGEVGAAHNAADFVKDLEHALSGKNTLPVLRAAAEKDPTDLEAALSLARYLSNRYAAETVRICKRILADGKDLSAEHEAELLFLQGYAEQNRGGDEAALVLWERVITKHPKTEGARDAVTMCSNVLPMLPPERGLAFLSKALELADEETREQLEYTRGYLYLRAAEAAYLKRGENAGDDPNMLNMAAWECFLHGWHTEKATQWARKAVRLSRRAPHILDTLANLLFKQGKIAEAIRLEEEAMAKASEPDMRAEFEENLAKWNAAKVLRAERVKPAKR